MPMPLSFLTVPSFTQTLMSLTLPPLARGFAYYVFCVSVSISVRKADF